MRSARGTMPGVLLNKTMLGLRSIARRELLKWKRSWRIQKNLKAEGRADPTTPLQYPTSNELSIGRFEIKAFDCGGD
ncbi:hypothetical protein PVAP13_8KG330700 [Panicum virgatum]|uniref:Uncharacterized protein n=1 Tax=Panicum virgatum TaxID=38727 RepID=A0A8T0PTC9_PANVG|nr:hypothetical protein PVAP13_8KG330700 [Panicum virgatum]